MQIFTCFTKYVSAYFFVLGKVFSFLFVFKCEYKNLCVSILFMASPLIFIHLPVFCSLFLSLSLSLSLSLYLSLSVCVCVCVCVCACVCVCVSVCLSVWLYVYQCIILCDIISVFLF
jgi:hypothetical protein